MIKFEELSKEVKDLIPATLLTMIGVTHEGQKTQSEIRYFREDILEFYKKENEGLREKLKEIFEDSRAREE